MKRLQQSQQLKKQSQKQKLRVNPGQNQKSKMKHLILIICLLAFSVLAKAQATQPVLTNPNGLALDTASQAAAEGGKAKIAGAQKVVSIVVITTKISGTIAGTVSWQGSNDLTGAASSFATISTTALVDASTNYNYKEVDKGYLWYRALITQTGTSSLSYKGQVYSSVAK